MLMRLFFGFCVSSLAVIPEYSLLAGSDNSTFTIPTTYSEIRRLRVDWDVVEDGLLPCIHTFGPEELRRGSWYISFSGIANVLTKLRSEGQLTREDKICGEFKHGNLAGSSFFFSAKDPVTRTLDGLMPLDHPRSIWDRLECDKIRMRLKKVTEGEFQLVMIETGACKYVWDD